MYLRKYLAYLIFLLAQRFSYADYSNSCSFESDRQISCRPNIYWCSVTVCKETHCEYNTEDATSVRIGSACFIPRYFFRDSPNLGDIAGTNSGIEMLAPWSFVNLPRIVSIKLAFNSIRYIFEDTFVNVSVKHLDLSWNKLSYIEDKALSNLNKLESIDLSYNDLFQQPALPRETIRLNLSHNSLAFALLFGKITIADFSYNKLKSIGLSTSTNIELLDIVMNELSESNPFSHIRVKKLRIAFNNFMNYPGFMEFTPQQILLYPNPWDCESLKSTWQDFNEAKVQILRSSVDDRFPGLNESFPICISYGNRNKEDVRQRFRNLYKPFINQKICSVDENCNDEEICRNGNCWDPCKKPVCEADNDCYVRNHKIVCHCKNNSKLNPFVDKSRCYFEDCFVDADCPKGKICNRRKCQFK